MEVMLSFLYMLVFLPHRWSTSDLRASGRLTLTNSGRRDGKARMTVRQAQFGSRSGIVGGHIEMHELVLRG